MLSISPNYQGNGRRGVLYCLEKVANSRDDYYVGRGEALGVWLGHGAAALDLSGTVDTDDYLAVMEGRSPSMAVSWWSAKVSVGFAGGASPFPPPNH